MRHKPPFLFPALLLAGIFSASAPAQQAPPAQLAEAGASDTAPAAPTDTSDPARPQAEAAPAPALITADENGFQFKAADNTFNLRLRGEVQSDGRFFVDDPAEAGANTFFLRRVRTAFQGTLYSNFDFLLRADFGQGRADLVDAYLDARLTPALNMQGGKLKAPVSLERLQSAADRTFIELSFPVGLLPNRDVGLLLHGHLFRDRVEYQLGVFNGVVDGSSGDLDTFDSKDVVARIFAQPFRTAPVPVLQGLGLGIAATTGTQYGSVSATNLPSFRTPARQTFFRFRSGSDAASTAIADGRRTRIAPQGYYYAGPFGLTAEYAHNTERVRLGVEEIDLATAAWQVTTGFLLTGEDATFRRLKPKRPFDRSTGHWGAFEVAARIQSLRVDSDAFPVYASPAQAAESALGWGIGLNWYLNANVRFAVNYERTTFEAAPGGVALDPESLVLSRIQLAF